MGFSAYIAKRYLRSKSSQNAVNIINFITFLVIVIGAAALFVVLSAFSGLKTFSLQFTNTFDPDLKARPTSGKFFTVTPSVLKELENAAGVAHFSKEIEERIYLSFEEKNHIAYLKGIDEAYHKVTGIDSTLYFGNWGVAENQAVIGLGIFNLLGGPLNNYLKPLNAITLKPGKGSISANALNSRSFYNQMPLVVSGVYAVEDDLDKKYVFTRLPIAQAFLEKDSTQVSGINFKLNPNASIEKVKRELQQILGTSITVVSRRELNSTLYRMLNTENVATYLIFTLVLIIALFNVVGAIIMMILDKQQNSKTLYALGTTLPQLRNIYFLQGLMVTSLGGLIGLFLGSVLVLSQITFKWLKITPTLAYPVEFKLINLVIVMATIFILGLLSAKIASSRITKKLVAAT
ncbi:ABC transporter permease [Flavobacterium sp. ASW18X]|uniref:ABC transporter permease n=1 Tax=Flavobacterium sp. ASW18X TaxID=2572595 RepID=UPI0010AE0371|nr:ABC transporter permease [Flavobacterium sp. ASW18X]TKD65147.1 ABC transporter permease [Flavobacterium sp. ASW18X]